VLLLLLLLQHIQPPGTLDGGDVLQLPDSKHILVGLSRRTNNSALQQMQALLPGHTVHGVSVAHGLHLKSACTALDGRTMVYADNDAGEVCLQHASSHARSCP
jgi:dimethylargininase